MSIKMELDATYDGMDVAEAAKYAMKLRDLGMPDEWINEMLKRNKDDDEEEQEILAARKGEE